MTEETSAGDEGAVEVRNNESESQYEIFLDGLRIGLLQYSVTGKTVTTPHTEIDPAFGGRGLGKALVTSALDEFRDGGLFVNPSCPFVRNFIRDNPAYHDLVKGG